MKVKVWKILSLILIVVFALSTANSVYALTVIATIPVTGTSPGNYYAAYDPVKGEVFVSNEGVATVSVISDSTDAVVATVPVRFSPGAIAYDSGTGEMFVTNGGPSTTLGTVSVISDSSNTVVSNVTVGTTPVGIAYDSSKGEVFVTNSGDQPPDISVISDGTNTVVATISLGLTGYNPIAGIVYDSSKGELFVAVQGQDTVMVISDGSNSVVATVDLGTRSCGAPRRSSARARGSARAIPARPRSAANAPQPPRACAAPRCRSDAPPNGCAGAGRRAAACSRRAPAPLRANADPCSPP